MQIKEILCSNWIKYK